MYGSIIASHPYYSYYVDLYRCFTQVQDRGQWRTGSLSWQDLESRYHGTQCSAVYGRQVTASVQGGFSTAGLHTQQTLREDRKMSEYSVKPLV